MVSRGMILFVMSGWRYTGLEMPRRQPRRQLRRQLRRPLRLLSNLAGEEEREGGNNYFLIFCISISLIIL